jgi:murein L,D-transpeptidase YcbB/YkuD
MYSSIRSFNTLNAHRLLTLTLLSVIFYSCSQHVAQVSIPVPAKSDTTAVATRVAGKPVLLDSTTFGKALAKEQAKAQEFYRKHSFQSQWLLDNQPSPLYAAAEAVLSEAGKFGLDPADYDLAAIQENVKLLYSEKTAKAQTLTALDRHITEMLFKYTTHLSVGKIIEPKSGRSIWVASQRIDRGLDLELIGRAQTPEAILAAIQALQPAHEQYGKLERALAYYRALEKNVPAPVEVTKGVKIKPEEHNPIITAVRKKLSLTDMRVYPVAYDSVLSTFDSTRYDAGLVSAVKEFQTKHGLEADGIIGERTLRFLNQSFKEKADIIALNMERLRWSREKYGDNYIQVNVPAYTLTVYENQKPTMNMRVIVGAVDKPTPIFNDAMSHIVFSPTWTVPTSIIKEEIIPRLKSDSSYYVNKNYAFYKDEVAIDPTTETWDDSANPYKYRIVQQPGPDNSLGRVKFLLTNTMSVYLHDTPNHRLFTKDYRALSHGCVRLDEPARFAAYLLRDQTGWDVERIKKAMNDSIPATVRLKKRYDVYIDYITAWVDENDSINFREDIYGHDKRQLQLLFPKEKDQAKMSGDVAGL